jgi:hypothetical protein
MAIIQISTIHDNGSFGNTERRHLRVLKMFLVAAFCLAISFAASAANFTATIDRDTIALGENATLSLVFEGGQPKSVPQPDVPGLQFANAGNAQNFSFINGQMSSTVTVTLTVTPRQTGNFTIPAMTAEIGGQQFQTPPLKLTVTQPGAPSNAQINSGSELAFMQFQLPQKKVYPGEIVTGQLLIFFRDDVQRNLEFQLTGMPADGFSIGKRTQGGTERKQIGNRVYSIIPVSVALTATKAGTLSIGPITANSVLLIGANGGGQVGPFGNFFGGEEKQVSLAADPVTVESVPLPTQNVPPNFNGAIGDYTMTVSAGPTNVAVGDPVTVRVQISGQGALDSITLPGQSAWNNFKTFSPTSKTQLSDDLGNEGTKTFEQIVTPENANVHEIPPFSFSFFNPDDGNYHTLTQPATPLSVTAAGVTPLPAIAATKPAENQAPQDIMPIRQNLGTLAQTGTPLIMRPAFLALQSVPVLAFLAAFVWRRREDSLANNPRLRRQRAVAQLVASGLNDLNKFAVENKSNEFFAVLFRLLQEQLGERLDCAAGSITEADAETRLMSLGANPETLNSLRELFQACNQARYAPVQTSQELSALATKFKKTVGELQDLKK